MTESGDAQPVGKVLAKRLVLGKTCPFGNSQEHSNFDPTRSLELSEEAAEPRR
jgi:hypothetical protein